MNRTAIAVLALMLTYAASARSQTRTSVFYESKSPDCKRVLIDDVEYHLIRHGDVLVATSFEFVSDYIAVNVYVENGTKADFDVLPDKIFLASYKRFADLQNHKTPDVQAPVPSSKIQNSILGQGKWRSFFGLMAAGLATNTYTFWDYQTGTYSTVTTPNYAAQAQAQAAAAERARQNRQVADKVESIMLRGNTVFPGKNVFGYIFFKAKKHEFDTVTIPINDVDYIFMHRFEIDK